MVPSWYLCLSGETIVAGMGVVENHDSFYERYGWEFLCMAQGKGDDRMYVHRAE